MPREVIQILNHRLNEMPREGVESYSYLVEWKEGGEPSWIFWDSPQFDGQSHIQEYWGKREETRSKMKDEFFIGNSSQILLELLHDSKLFEKKETLESNKFKNGKIKSRGTQTKKRRKISKRKSIRKTFGTFTRADFENFFRPRDIKAVVSIKYIAHIDTRTNSVGTALIH